MESVFKAAHEELTEKKQMVVATVVAHIRLDAPEIGCQTARPG